MITLGDGLRMNAGRWPDKLAVVDDRHRLTFGQLNARVDRLANGLRALGIARGDRVAVFARNSVEYLELFHACAKLGVCIVTLNFWLRPAEVVVLFNHSDATTLVVDAESQDAIAGVATQLTRLAEDRVIVIGAPMTPGWRAYEEVVESGSEEEPTATIDWNDPYWMLYTSGTTGDPKGVMRSHRRTALCGWYMLLEFGLSRHDYFLVASPFFHGVTFFPLMVLQLGGSVFVVRDVDAERMLEAIEAEGITSAFLVPTVIDALLQADRLPRTRFGSLRMLVTGGAPLPTMVKQAVMTSIGAVLYEFYGASESGYLTVLHPADQLRKERCAGQPAFGADVEIRDARGRALPPGRMGEIFSRCGGRFDGYYKDAGRTAAALHGEWFTAGDLGMKDEENYVYIIDRKNDLIISGGENVYPREIEDVLRFHPAVLECAVVGIPDTRWGEAVKAFVVLRVGERLSAAEVIEYCGAQLAGFKRPKVVEFVSGLPKTASGKIQKTLLRARP